MGDIDSEELVRDLLKLGYTYAQIEEIVDAIEVNHGWCS